MRLRLLIPILACLIGIGVVVGTFYNARESENLTQEKASTPSQAQSEAKPKPADTTTPKQAASKPLISEGANRKSPGPGPSADSPSSNDKPSQADAQQDQAGESAATAQAASAQPKTGQSANGQAAANPTRVEDSQPSNASVNQTSSDESSDQPSGPQRSLADLHLQPGTYQKWLRIGSDHEDQAYHMQVVFNGFGAGIQRLTLAQERATAKGDKPYALIDLPLDRVTHYTPYAARTVWVNGQAVQLSNDKWKARTVKTTDTGQAITFRAEIVNAQNQPVLEIVRTYRLAKDSYELSLDQRLINHSGRPLEIVWKQNAQGDLVQSLARYVGDRRKLVTGYFKPGYDNRLRIYANNGYVRRRTLVNADAPSLWPNPNLTANNDYELAWLAVVNRYFAMVTHPTVPASSQGPPKTADIPSLDAGFEKVGVSLTDPDENLQNPGKQYLLLTLETAKIQVSPGQKLDRSLGIYAGPRQSEVFEQQPFAALHLGRLVRYQLGCTWFTFQPLAHGLLWFLKLIEGQIISLGGVGIGVRDWGVAIMIMVACVRLLLHPITKKSQANMMKMGKQMQVLKPEMDKIKKKYKDDQQKLNAEMMKLYREKGMNPANMLGCAPMLLQTPIWIALYAMLFYAIELRHEPAFYGFFQWISAGHWDFLADLSRSDHFITFFDEPHSIQLIFIRFDYSAFNILPLLMGVVFYFNQKFTQPPAANDQAAQQQKMMKFMVLLFPLFLYSAPSGLTLYICTSTLAGIFDSYLVRKHVREQEEAGTLFQKKQRKPGGFMDRMHKVMEQKQQEVAAKQQQAQKAGGSGAGGGGNREQRRKKSR